jgi:hypothetical protein
MLGVKRPALSQPMEYGYDQITQEDRPRGLRLPDCQLLVKTVFPPSALTIPPVVCTENLIRVDAVIESPKLAE